MGETLLKLRHEYETKAKNYPVSFRVASKGVYADGGCYNGKTRLLQELWEKMTIFTPW